MDIAKYIGLFLLKNHFCYIHGLGNLELRKKPATHDGEALRGPSYEVVITQGGSIDDNLANFIATNEFISISKASNALRDFSTTTRAQLLEGKDIVIPNIGTFHEENGKISFVTDANLRYTPNAMPAMRTDRRPDEAGVTAAAARPYTPPLPSQQTVSEPTVRTQPSPTQNVLQQVNWMKVIVATVALLIIVVIAIFAFKFIKERRSSSASHSATTQPIIPPPPSAAAQQKADSIAAAMAAVAAKNADTLRNYNFVIADEGTNKKAEMKVARMKSFNHPDAQMFMLDSSTYLITLTLRCAPSDTTKIMDSLGRHFGYPGVSIYP